MKKKTMAKYLSLMLAAAVTATLMAGCGNRAKSAGQAEAEETTNDTADSADAEDDVAEISAEQSVTAIQNVPLSFSDILFEITPGGDYQTDSVTLTYTGTEIVIDAEEGISGHEDNAIFTALQTEDELLNASNVPNISLTFADVTEEAETLAIAVTLTDANGEKKAEAATAVNVVPEEVAEISDLTRNLKISETLAKYDFNVYASNIMNKTGSDSNIKAVTVKDSNVEFRKPGHYVVTYEVTFKEKVDINGSAVLSADIPTDIEVVDKEMDMILGKDVITENVKAETKAEEKTDDEKTDKTESAAGKETQDSSPASGSADKKSNSSASSSGPSNSSSGSSSGQTAKSSPTHRWKDHTAKRWISNWVTVVDTPARTVYGAQLYTEQADGTWLGNGETYWFENGFTVDDFKTILKNKIKNERSDYLERKV